MEESKGNLILNCGSSDRFRYEEKRIRNSYREFELTGEGSFLQSHTVSIEHVNDNVASEETSQHVNHEDRSKKKRRKSATLSDEEVLSWAANLGINYLRPGKDDEPTSSSITSKEPSSSASKISELCSTALHSVNPEAYVIDSTEVGAPQGLYIIKRALTTNAQLHWAKIALEQYTRSHHTNLTNLQSLNGSKSDDISAFDSSNLWLDSIANNDNFKSFKPMRWACLGYHYDWTARKYQKDLKSPFPPDLAEFCRKLANHVSSDITAEAAIVNYYPCGTSMSGHLDDAELTMEEPIVSISIGCPAIFLIGGRTKDVKPTSIFVESGDVVVMSGESRYCYHGVPIVLSHYQGSDRFFRNVGRESADYHVARYLTQGRINMNVRRVLPHGVEWFDKQGSGAMKQKLNHELNAYEEVS